MPKSADIKHVDMMWEAQVMIINDYFFLFTPSSCLHWRVHWTWVYWRVRACVCYQVVGTVTQLLSADSQHPTVLCWSQFHPATRLWETPLESSPRTAALPARTGWKVTIKNEFVKKKKNIHALSWTSHKRTVTVWWHFCNWCMWGMMEVTQSDGSLNALQFVCE